jgi:hypothetical protein
MDQTISAEKLIKIVQESDLDPTIKDILIRDISNEGVNDFLVEQVIAYCDNAIAVIKQSINKENPSA